MSFCGVRSSPGLIGDMLKVTVLVELFNTDFEVPVKDAGAWKGHAEFFYRMPKLRKFLGLPKSAVLMDRIYDVFKSQIPTTKT